MTSTSVESQGPGRARLKGLTSEPSCVAVGKSPHLSVLRLWGENANLLSGQWDESGPWICMGSRGEWAPSCCL